jgi:hypothetical protein
MNNRPMTTAEACQKGIVTGVATGNLIERVDIDDFMAGVDGSIRLNLLLLAFNKLQEDHDFKSWFSYFSIAGIHGNPNVKWNDVDSNATYNFLDREGRKEKEAWDTRKQAVPLKGDEWMGYCTHNSIQFPTWHRRVKPHLLDISG